MPVACPPPVSFLLLGFLDLQDLSPGLLKTRRVLRKISWSACLLSTSIMSGCCSLLNDFFCLYWDDLIKRFFFSLFVNMRNYSDWLLNIKPTVNRFFPDGSPAVSPLLPYPPSPSPSFFLPSSLLCSSSFSSCLFSDYFSCHLFSSSSLIWGVLLKCHCFMHCGYIFLDTHYLIQGLFLFAKQGIVPRLCITSFHHLCGSTVLREMETERMWWVCLCECVCVCARLCEYLCVSVSVWVCLCVCVCVTASVWVCLCVCASVWPQKKSLSAVGLDPICHTSTWV